MGRSHHAALALVVCAAVAVGFVYDDLGDLGGDNAQYILLAQSLATGQGYRTINEPGTPPHTYYPPLFPLLLAPVVATVGIRFWALHLVVAACGLLALIWWGRYLQDSGEDDRIAALVVFLIGISPLWCAAINRILSDVPYTAWLCLALWGASRCARAAAPFGRWWWVTVVGTLALFLTRTIGLVAAAAIVCVWCDPRSAEHRRHGRREAIALATIVAAAAVVWWGRGWVVGAEQPSYLRQYAMRDPYDPALGAITAEDLLARVVANLGSYGTTLAEVFVWGATGWPQAGRWFLSCMIILAIVVGWVKRAAPPRWGVVEWAVAGHLGAVLLWPQAFGDARFLVPVVPMLTLYAVGGGRWMRRLAMERLGAAALASTAMMIGLGLLVVVNGVGVVQAVWGLQTGRRYGAIEQEFLDVQRWLREHSRPGDVILSRKPTITALFTGRQAIVYPYTDEAERIMATIERHGVDYVIVDNFSYQTRRYLVPAIRRFPERFESEGIVIGGQVVLKVRS